MKNFNRVDIGSKIQNNLYLGKKFSSLLLTLPVLILAGFSLVSFVPVVLADGINPACPSIYGAQCPTGQLSINKTIKNPKTGEFVDALSSSDVIFIPDQSIDFRIEVKNTGSVNLSGISVFDRLPASVIFVSGTGSFDQSSAVLSWSIDNLNPGESKFFQIGTRIKSQTQLPQNDMTCVTNFAQAQKDAQFATDTTAFCFQIVPMKVISQTTVPVQALPKTGLPLAAWFLVGLTPFGRALKRFADSDLKNNTGTPEYIWGKREFLKD